MSVLSSVDVAGRRRSPATFSAFHQGRPPANKGRRYPADPPRVEEIVAVMRVAGDGLAGDRIRGLIVVLWRGGLRVQEALDLHERDLDPRRGALLIRSGKGGRRREAGMDDGLRTYERVGIAAARAAGRSAVLHHRRPDARPTVAADGCALPAAPAGRSGGGAASVRPAPAPARPRRRDGPGGIPLNVIQRQLGHTNLGVTSTYLQGIDNAEIINTIHQRRAPMIPATAGLRL